MHGAIQNLATTLSRSLLSSLPEVKLQNDSNAEHIEEVPPSSPPEKRRRLLSEEEEQTLEREKVKSDADRATFDLIAEYPWLVIKIFQDSTGVVAGEQLTVNYRKNSHWTCLGLFIHRR